MVLENPSINEIDTDGNYIDTFILPPQLHMQEIESGRDQNGAVEGLSFSDNFRSLFVSAEEPLYDDGPREGLNDPLRIIRILKFDGKTRNQ